MGIDKANEWTISYISAFSIDTFFLELILGYSKIFILKKELLNKKSSCIIKILGDKGIVNYLLEK